MQQQAVLVKRRDYDAVLSPGVLAGCVMPREKCASPPVAQGGPAEHANARARCPQLQLQVLIDLFVCLQIMWQYIL
jgi:hypothetical protein